MNKKIIIAELNECADYLDANNQLELADELTKIATRIANYDFEHSRDIDRRNEDDDFSEFSPSQFFGEEYYENPPVDTEDLDLFDNIDDPKQKVRNLKIVRDEEGYKGEDGHWIPVSPEEAQIEIDKIEEDESGLLSKLFPSI